MSRRSSGTRVFVGGLSYRVRERDLEKFFQKIGRVTDISMKNGFAFVEFDDHRDADDAVYELNGKDLMGERVAVEIAQGPGYRRPHAKRFNSTRPPPYSYDRPRKFWVNNRDDNRNNDRYGPPTRTEFRVIIENLSSKVSWQDLKDYMRQAGEVTYADAHKLHKNEGVVEFSSYSDMKNALDQLDGTELNGRRIRVVEDKRRRRARSSSSHSRSKSRSRSRSRSGVKERFVSHSRSRSKSISPRDSKSPVVAKRRSPSGSPVTRKRAKRSESESPVRRSRSRSPNRNGRSGGSGDEDD